MEYLELRFYNDPALSEILLAWLGESGFDMFTEREEGLNAYIPAKDFNEAFLTQLLSEIPGMENIRYEKTFIEDQNWNTQWESNFEPVTIAGKVHIRAPFHPPENFETELIIEPKMSFGTGHHSTTSLMVEFMLSLPMKGKTVLDMGCGSGILAILASKFKAERIVAVDNDDWAVENCRENCIRNSTSNVEVHKGEAGLLNGLKFDIILANINRNVLLSDMPVYATALQPGGDILLSGFLTEDRQLIYDRAAEFGLKVHAESSHLNWMVMHFKGGLK